MAIVDDELHRFLSAILIVTGVIDLLAGDVLRDDCVLNDLL